MVELERESDGFLKSFDFKIAERALKDAGKFPGKYWKLPEHSTYKFSNGSLIVKAVNKPKKEFSRIASSVD